MHSDRSEALPITPILGSQQPDNGLIECGLDCTKHASRPGPFTQHRHVLAGPTQFYVDTPRTLRQIVGEAIGQATMCWEHIDQAGIFDSERATQIIDDLLDELPPHWDP